ncbi:unnamed protein product, partial [Mesorhabditis spiculigera]
MPMLSAFTAKGDEWHQNAPDGETQRWLNCGSYEKTDGEIEQLVAADRMILPDRPDLNHARRTILLQRENREEFGFTIIVSIFLRRHGVDTVHAIDSVRPGSIARKAGMRPGDIIAGINGYETIGLSHEQLHKLLSSLTLRFVLVHQDVNRIRYLEARCENLRLAIMNREKELSDLEDYEIYIKQNKPSVFDTPPSISGSRIFAHRNRPATSSLSSNSLENVGCQFAGCTFDPTRFRLRRQFSNDRTNPVSDPGSNEDEKHSDYRSTENIGGEMRRFWIRAGSKPILADDGEVSITSYDAAIGGIVTRL